MWIVFAITVAPSYVVSDIVKGVNLNWERTVKLFGIVGYTVFGALFEFEPLNMIASAGSTVFYQSI